MSHSLISKFEPLWDAQCVICIIENNEKTALYLKDLFANLFPQSVIYIIGKNEWTDADLVIERIEKTHDQKINILTLCGIVSGKPHPIFNEHPIVGLRAFIGLNPKLVTFAITDNETVLEIAKEDGADVILQKSRMDVLQSRQHLIEYMTV